MKIPIDSVGRLVVPKPIRAELGIDGPAVLEAVARDGVIELVVADAEVHLEERAGGPVIVADAPVPPLTVEDVRAAIDRVRR